MAILYDETMSVSLWMKAMYSYLAKTPIYALLGWELCIQRLLGAKFSSLSCLQSSYLTLQKELMLQFSQIFKESRCTTKNVKLSLNRIQRRMY